MGDLIARFGETIRARRLAKGLTQARLAEATNLSLEWISRIERGQGKPSLDVLEALAPALGVGIPDLFQPTTPKQAQVMRIEALLQRCEKAELVWVEGLCKPRWRTRRADWPATSCKNR